jgi:hypothetical protein
VNTGESVTWQINDELPHNVEGVDGPDAGWADGAYTSPIVAVGVAEYTFTQPGTYTYLCTVHPTQMTGTVTVTGPPVTPTPTPSPTTSPSPSPTAEPPAPTPSPGPSGQTPSTPGDTTPAPGTAARDSAAPALSGLRVKGIRRGARLTFRVSETASVTVRFKKRKSRKVVRTARRQVRAGKRTITVRGGRLRRGRYTVELEARDSGGNRTPVQTASVRIKRAKG